MDQLLAEVPQEAFLPPGERDLYNFVPEPIILGDINLNYTGLLFRDSQPEKPDIASILQDQDVPEELKERVRIAVDESHAKNCWQVQVLDSKVRGLYTTAEGLVNDGTE